MRRLSVLCVAVISAALLISLTAFAQKAEEKGKPPSEPDMMKMMAEYMKLAAPGPSHDVFKKMAGEWSCATKSWMGPDQPPMDSPPGTSTMEPVFGGRYLKFDHSGDMMGMPFTGLGYMGFDNFKKQYWMFWIDNMSTTMSSGWGTASADGKEISLMGKMDEPMTGEKDKDVKYVYKFVSDKTMIFEIWDMLPGKPFKAMEMTYTKK